MAMTKGDDVKLGLEKWLSIFAVATFAYYVLTFSFEIGFFWKIGLEYMPAFGLIEHAVHAAALTIGTIGAALFLWLLGVAPNMLISDSRRKASDRAKAEADSVAEWSDWKQVWLPRLLTAPALIFLSPALWHTIDSLMVDGARPMLLFGPLVFFSFLVGLLSVAWPIPRLAWAYPALLAALLFPVALGDFMFDRKMNDPLNPMRRVEFGDKVLQARIVFIGSDKALLKIGNGLVLATLDGSSKVTVWATEPDNGRFPERYPF
jgi:hypothetical protein